MQTARDAVVLEVERMLAELDMKASPFAKEAKVATTTLTRFLANPDAPLLSTSTLVKLREAHQRLLATRKALPGLDYLTKDAKKRALIAMMLTATNDEVVAIEKAIDSLPKVTPPKRKINDNPA